MQPVKKMPIVQQVQGQIKKMIEDEKYKPGEKLPTEKEFCENLNVGRGTIREAFRVLETMGVVELKPGRGAFVSNNPNSGNIGPIDWLFQNEDQLNDSIEIRTFLEPMAARATANKCTQEQLLQLEKIHIKFLEAVRESDSVRIAKLDEQFHRLIIKYSGNKLLVELYNSICRGIQTFRRRTFEVEQNANNAIEPHAMILKAIKEKNAILAECEMRKHIEKVQEDLNKNIKDKK